MKLKHHDDPIFLQDAYEALAEQFTSRAAFDLSYASIANDDDKNRFLRIASNYLFLYKQAIGSSMFHIEQIRLSAILRTHSSLRYCALKLNPSMTIRRNGGVSWTIY